MRVKDEVLLALERAQGEYVGGERLAALCGVSRQAIGKAIKALLAQGYEIVASPKGYSLAPCCDLISPALIEAETGIPVLFRRIVGSTNVEAARAFLEQGECIVVALGQTAGRSKDGGGFPSPENAGIYFSAAFPVEMDLSALDRFRFCCADAVGRVIEACSGRAAERVRLDEFYLDGKKSAGILTECFVNTAVKKTEFAVVGVGMYTGKAFSREYEPVPSVQTRNRVILSLWRELCDLRDRFK